MKLLKPIKSKREENLGKSVGILVVSAILFAIAAMIAFYGAQQFSKLIPSEIAILGYAGIGGGMFLLIFLGGLFYGWLLQLIMNVFTGKGKYLDGLTVIAYSSLPVSIGAIIAVIVGLIPWIGSVISFAVMAIFGVIGYALAYQLTRSLFESDMITAFVAIIVLTGATALAVSISAVTGISVLKGLLPFLPK